MTSALLPTFNCNLQHKFCPPSRPQHITTIKIISFTHWPLENKNYENGVNYLAFGSQTICQLSPSTFEYNVLKTRKGQGTNRRFLKRLHEIYEESINQNKKYISFRCMQCKHIHVERMYLDDAQVLTGYNTGNNQNRRSKLASIPQLDRKRKFVTCFIAQTKEAYTNSMRK